MPLSDTDLEAHFGEAQDREALLSNGWYLNWTYMVPAYTYRWIYRAVLALIFVTFIATNAVFAYRIGTTEEQQNAMPRIVETLEFIGFGGCCFHMWGVSVLHLLFGRTLRSATLVPVLLLIYWLWFCIFGGEYLGSFVQGLILKAEGT